MDRDDSGWLSFYELYRPFIAKQLATYPKLRDRADDIAHEVMLVVFKELGEWQRGRTGSFRKWLRIVTKYRVHEMLRSNEKFPELLSDAAALERELSDWDNPASLASQQWDSEHEKRLLNYAMKIVKQDVEPQTWAAFERYALNGESPKSVAESLNCEINSVYLAKTRITRRLKKEVEGLNN
ncbi:MAG: sigma-70 family RNA polymerase sigma factor [Pirellulaceae bacterium]|nr:sigma-70 family RNA polymerase sigma factor [Pirellulaceae bacterium]